MKNRIWAISDLHLPHGTMDAYGMIWKDHDLKLLSNILNVVQKNDILLFAGDIINAINEEQVSKCVDFFSKIPCKVVICPGNHDIWLSPDKRTKKAIRPKCLPSNVIILDGDCFYAGDTIIGGLMFWCFKDAFPWDGHVGIMERLQKHQSEALFKFNLVLNQFKKEKEYKKKILMMHFPPIAELALENSFTASITNSGTTICVFGHAHGVTEEVPACDAVIDNVKYKLISADYRNMTPVYICDYCEK